MYESITDPANIATLTWFNVPKDERALWFLHKYAEKTGCVYFNETKDKYMIVSFPVVSILCPRGAFTTDNIYLRRKKEEVKRILHYHETDGL